MTNQELWERIRLTLECPPFPIEWERQNGFCWFEFGEFRGDIGVAVAMVGQHSPNEKWTTRTHRANLLGYEWHYLMHFEIAINCLFAGDIKGYNYSGAACFFPFVELSILPKSGKDASWVKYALKPRK